MTNRKRLLQSNEYDMLVKVQKYLSHSYDPTLCILCALSGKDVECLSDCEKCIQQWLNLDDEVVDVVWKK